MAYQSAAPRRMAAAKLIGNPRLDSVLIHRVKRLCDRLPVCDAERVGVSRLMTVGCQAVKRSGSSRLSGDYTSQETKLAREMQDYLVNHAETRPPQCRRGRSISGCGFCGQLHRAFSLASIALSGKPEGRRRLSQGVKALPPRVRQVMTLYHHDKFTYPEIARAMNTSTRAVCSLHREGMFMLIPQLRPLTPAPRCPMDAPAARRRREPMLAAPPARLAGIAVAVASVTLAIIIMSV